MINSSHNTTAVLEQIRQSLEPLRPYKIILFGSYASGVADENSDLDLLVILDRDSVPRNFKEKMQLHSKVTRKLRHIRRTIPMDIIVQTRPIYKQFSQSGSMFAQDIQQNGKVIYEKNHPRVA